MRYPKELSLDNMRANLGRNLPEVRQCRPHKHVMSIAGGGPSLSDTKDQLKGYVCAINGSLAYLLDSGITPSACGVVDPGEHIADMLVPRKDVHYYIASMAHPNVFEKLKGCHVIMWHASGPEGAEELLKAEKPDDWLMIGGGTTMGVRWMNLGYVMGFREFHVHGLDSSYRDGETHSYKEHDRVERVIVDGFETSPNFVQQVSDFGDTMKMISGSSVTLYGDGLLQSTYRQHYWKKNNELRHITPPGERWPEGEDIKEIYKQIVGDGSVVDFGCGDGRMVDAFSPDKYIGVDINPSAIEACSKAYPRHKFSAEIQPSDVAICHTVLVHVPDSEIDSVVESLSQCDSVIVSEITGREWRRNGNPPVFNREIEEYEMIFCEHGMRLEYIKKIPYNRYGGAELSMMVFSK